MHNYYENNQPIIVIPASEPESRSRKAHELKEKRWIIGSKPDNDNDARLFSSLMVRRRRMGDCFVARLRRPPRWTHNDNKVIYVLISF
jgi:hypothetical protein